MWARTQAAQVMQANKVNLMQIDMMQLSVLQTRMDNITMQSTLTMGFALAMFGGETLLPLVEDEGVVCIYKTWYHRMFAVVFFFTVVVTLSLSLLVVVVTLEVKQLAQEAALLVSTNAAVARARVHVRAMSRCFKCSICAQPQRDQALRRRDF
uniref:Uncharacterized protein n=1 Tax=Emiliania huxleyi TaxID=2903 RepID=A0A7S3WK79_EMIHU